MFWFIGYIISGSRDLSDDATFYLKPHTCSQWQPLSAAVPANVIAVVLHFHLCVDKDLFDGTSISTEGIVKTSPRRAVACRVSGVKGVGK